MGVINCFFGVVAMGSIRVHLQLVVGTYDSPNTNFSCATMECELIYKVFGEGSASPRLFGTHKEHFEHVIVHMLIGSLGL